MHRIVEAVRPHAALLIALVPDLMLVIGFLGLTIWLSTPERPLWMGFFFGVPFLMGLVAEAAAFLRPRARVAR